MNQRFQPSDAVAGCLFTGGLQGCRCRRPSRRLFGAALLAGAAAAALPAWADGVQLGDRSALSQLVPAEEIEAAAAQQYRKLLEEAAAQRALAPESNPQLQRLRYIAQRLIPHATSPNLRPTARAAQWNWEVNLIASQQVNAFCMPGGKIAFFTGLLNQLRLTDDEVAMVMGHEMTHALREHSREQLGKNAATSGLIELGAALFGLGSGGRTLANLGAQLMSLRFSREDETEADMGGLDLAARAGYDPRAGLTLWDKMAQASQGSPPEWLSSHPAGPSRIEQIRAHLPEVMPLYSRADKPRERFDGSAGTRVG
jgi:predicted Zn-dependent protease